MNGDTEAQIARIDERTKYIKEMLDKFVTKDEFNPVKKIVYGAVWLVVAGTVVGLFSLLIS